MEQVEEKNRTEKEQATLLGTKTIRAAWNEDIIFSARALPAIADKGPRPPRESAAVLLNIILFIINVQRNGLSPTSQAILKLIT